MTRTTLPASFAVVMAGVVLLGVAVGWTAGGLGDDGGNRPEAVAPVTTELPTATLPPTTTTVPIAPTCVRTPTFDALATLAGAFVAGIEAELVTGIAKALGSADVIVVDVASDLRKYLPNARGVVLLPFSQRNLAPVDYDSLRFVFYDAELAQAATLRASAIVVTLNVPALIGYADFIVRGLRDEATCNATTNQGGSR